MFTSRTLTGSTLYEQLNPYFRTIDFSDSPAVVTVSHFLRLAWNITNSSEHSCDEEGIGKFMRDTQAETQRLELEAANERKGNGEEEVEEENEEEIKEMNGKKDDEILAAGDRSVVEYSQSSDTHLSLDKEEEEKEEKEEEKGNQESDQEPKHALTDWHLAILKYWNHVYWDVMQFLPQVGLGIGHFHPPSHSSLSIPFSPTISSPPTSNPTPTPTPTTIPETNQEPTQQPVLKHTFATNTLLIPAYLSPGISLRMTIPSTSTPNTPTTQIETLGTFSASTKTEIWWLRQDIEVSFYLDIDSASVNATPRNDIAAVLAIGVLCDTMHEEAVEAIEGEEMQDEILEASVDIQIEEPVLELY